jgi:hypothetical protein
VSDGCDQRIGLVNRYLRDPEYVVVRGILGDAPATTQTARQRVLPFSERIGQILPQGPAGKLVDEVRDTGSPNMRGAKPNEAFVGE